jgi:hypothetical protein
VFPVAAVERHYFRGIEGGIIAKNGFDRNAQRCVAGIPFAAFRLKAAPDDRVCMRMQSAVRLPRRNIGTVVLCGNELRERILSFFGKGRFPVTIS